jgi:hypothetical protein
MITSLYIVASSKCGRKEKNYPIRVKDVMACDKNKKNKATLKSLLLLM